MKNTYSKILTIAVTTGIILSSSATAAFAWVIPSVSPQCDNNNKIVINFTINNITTQTPAHEDVTADNTSYHGSFNLNGTDQANPHSASDTIHTNQSSYTGTVHFVTTWSGSASETKTVNVSKTCDQPTPTPTRIPIPTPTPTREVTSTPTSTPVVTATPTPITPTPTTPILTNKGCDDVTQIGNINNANCLNQNQNQNQHQNQYNNNNQSQNNNQNVTVSYVYPTPQPQQVIVQPAPVATTLPSTGSPLTETLTLLGMLPTGFLIKKFTNRG